MRPRGAISASFTLLGQAVRESRRDRVPMIAQALAYSLFLAIPATALVVLGVFSLVADPALIDEVVAQLSGVMPAQAAALLEQSLRRSSESSSSGIVMTAVGFLLALWTTTSAAATLMTGLTTAHDRDDKRSFVRKRLVALLIVFALVVAAGLVVALLVAGPYVERWIGSSLHAESATAWAWWTVQWPILFAALLFMFAVVLFVGPDVAERSWKVVTPGAVTAVVVWLMASGGLAFYVAHFGSYEKTWGTLSAVVVTLLWLWVTSAALLFGAEVNAEARRVRKTAGAEPAAATRHRLRRAA
jgi:membrane protein